MKNKGIFTISFISIVLKLFSYDYSEIYCQEKKQHYTESL